MIEKKKAARNTWRPELYLESYGLYILKGRTRAREPALLSGIEKSGRRGITAVCQPAAGLVHDAQNARIIAVEIIY